MSGKKLSVWVLTALVVGNMVGSGIFMLPSTLAKAASPGGVLFAWVFTGVGVLFIALVFGTLSIKRPEITGGPQIYAKALFSKDSKASVLWGYLVSWGYWVANLAGIVAVITTFAGYLSTFFPVMNSSYVLFKTGDVTVTTGHLLNFLVCSALLWGVHFLIIKGVSGAGKVNFIATTAKVVGFFIFIILTLFAFQSSNLEPFITDEVNAGGQTVGIFGQLNHAAIATLWAFIGIESAVVFSSRAKSGRDVKTATIAGLLIALVIYIAITMLVMGTLTQTELVHSSKPLVDALAKVIGDTGGYILAALALISLLGSSVGWILLTAEVPFQSAKQGLFMKGFSKANKAGTPTTSLIITNIACQLFIFSTISQSISSAFDFVIYIATLSYLLPYLIAAIYLIKMVIKGKKNYQLNNSDRFIDGVIAILATLYSLWVIKAGTADLKTFLFGVAMILIGIVFYPIVMKAESQESR
ncbi:lysine:proton symporter (APA family) [Scopulibacillus darangshiensis]|uniref:Lysine:proton symporter (APA family) n=1 Tax=Scopulibacillus darangshiensis TaxID=442528 RepID=A0A4R2NL39_9BACL|nr:amino acid permease [Scopulibacillus darangshiensis]TCP22122.1 lysine:proton symporter (APA family) [Scopulibacillus darangshiensis]